MGDGLFERTLLYVTGKGGVGKTTVAASLGMAAAARGRRTIVCEVAEQERVSRAFAREGVRREQEVELASNLWAISIDPNAALREWLARQLGGAALRLLAGSSPFQHFVAAAPGAKELITIAKVWELAQLERWDAHNRTYDLVIVDAPSSGHGLAMLTAPGTFGEIARVGPIRRQAFRVRDMLADPRRTGYVAVALPEEMPVNETLELGSRLHDAVGLGLDAIIVNGLYPERFSGKEAGALREATANGLAGAPREAVLAALTEHHRARVQRAHLRRLRREAGVPVHTLPFLFAADIGLAEYGVLAGRLGRALA
jgi:anion-transporting  ArsA/GET3 family ATPase